MVWKRVLHIYIWRALFKNALSTITKKNDLNVNPKFVECTLEKSSPYIYMHTYIYLDIYEECVCTHIYIYLDIYEEHFPQTWSLILALTLETPVLQWRLTRFGKELFIYIWRALFQSIIYELGIGITNSCFRIRAYRSLEKSSSYIYIVWGTPTLVLMTSSFEPSLKSMQPKWGSQANNNPAYIPAKLFQ